MGQRPFRLGRVVKSHADPARDRRPGSILPTFDLPAHHLVTHAICVGMTGSGKTGLAIALVEEALRSKVPVLILDVKGDLANLALLFDELAPASFAPWVDADAARRDGKTADAVAEELAASWQRGLASWGLGPADVRALREGMALRIITPGTTGGGEPLHVLSPLEQHGDLWEIDEEGARESLGAALSLLLRMVERDPDPTRGREHVLLAHLAERRLRSGGRAGLEELLADLDEPPIATVGAMDLDDFFTPKERAELMKDLNALVASPTFATWRKGAPLDVAAWMRGRPGDPRTPATIVSVAHLEDEERMLVLSLVLEQALSYVRGLPGTTDLRALILFDEVFGFLPPHPANPPSKRPMLALLKQARAFGVGCVLATQNPIDLDYKALSNAGAWFIGRLQTDADRARVVEGLAGSDAGAAAGSLDPDELAATIKNLPPRTFFVRDVHDREAPTRLLETRWTLSWLRGPMTRMEIRRWAKGHAAPVDVATPAKSPPAAPPAKPVAVPSSGEGSVAPPVAPAHLAELLPKLAPRLAPKLPEGWRSIYPCAPEAALDTWRYAPHAAIVGRVEIVDARLGYRDARAVAVLAPIDDAGIDLSRATPFSAADFRHAAVPGAAYAPIGEVFEGARATRAREKALRECALGLARARVLHNPELKLVAHPGEADEAFAARCQMDALRTYREEHAALLAKHEPRIQKLSRDRDAARDAVARDPSAKLRARLAAAESSLVEATAKRDAAVRAREAQLRASAQEIVAKDIGAKTDALVVETYAIAWLPA